MILSCGSDTEQHTWLRFLQEVKNGHHRLSVPSLRGSTSSRGSGNDITVFDDNDIYEATEDLCKMILMGGGSILILNPAG